MSMRRKISGRTTAEIKKIKKEDVDLPVTTEDFDEALSRCKKSVSLSDVSKYESWMEEFGSCWRGTTSKLFLSNNLFSKQFDICDHMLYWNSSDNIQATGPCDVDII